MKAQSILPNPSRTRREFLGSAAAIAAGLGLSRHVTAAESAKPNSVFGGVRVGCISYSYRSMATSAEDTLKALLADGLSEVELMGGAIQQYAGITGGGGKNKDKNKGKEKAAPAAPAAKVTDADREAQLARQSDRRRS
jgi:hypothetical protein